MPHSSGSRIKSFDSLNTQGRSSKLLLPQYRSLVSHHGDGAISPRGDLCSPRIHVSGSLSSGHVGGQWVWPAAGEGALPLPADQRGRAVLLQGRRHRGEAAGGGGLVGRLAQRQDGVVPQQLRTGAEGVRWVALPDPDTISCFYSTLHSYLNLNTF